MAMRLDEQIAFCNRIMRERVGTELPAGTGGVLMVFPLGEPGAISYISNADRETMRHALRCLLTRWDQDAAAKAPPNPPPPPSSSSPFLPHF